METIRIAALQYYIRPVESFDAFRYQVEGLVDTAADYGCHLLVFPEYFTVQLLTLGNVRRPIREQILELAKQKNRYIEMMQKLAKKHKLHILAGTIPTQGEDDQNKLYNDSFFFGPTGDFTCQGKIHMTRFEKEDWNISSRSSIKVIETCFGKIAITICYDVEFPELARAAAKEGACLLIVPSCTDDRQSFLRVRYCAQARAIENQMYVVQATTVGSLPMVPAVSLNYGKAAIITPNDFPFARDGILAEGIPNQETMVIGDINFDTLISSRTTGTVLPLRDSETTANVLKKIEHCKC